MIRLTDRLWIGDSADEEHGDLTIDHIGAVLNVAQDLQGTVGWANGVEYAQVGLIDGPGNTLEGYYAAVLALASLVRRHKVLVFDHTGGRVLAVSLMYLNLTARWGWDGWMKILSERVEGELPKSNQVHKDAFNKLNWRVLATAIEG